MSTRDMRRAFGIFVLTVIVVLVVLVVLARYASRYPYREAQERDTKVTLTIPRGANFDKVSRALQQKGLINNRLMFRVYANYRGLASKVKAGTYQLNTKITPRRLLDVLVKGAPTPQVDVTVPEGKHMLEVARLIADKGVAPYKALVGAMRNRRLLRQLGIDADSAEGFLFPDTYKLKLPTAATQVVRQLCERHQRVFAKLQQTHCPKLAKASPKASEKPKASKKAPACLPQRMRRRFGWGHRELVTLASIVEKETGKAQERPLIAGVFLNRLLKPSFRPKLLQTDPTIIYGCTVIRDKSPACKKFEGRIRRIHLTDRQNRYNTYTHTGLPPGPIANPGRAALEAVFKPKVSTYLYFVSKNDGSHYFSSTKAEHERAVDKYQRGS